MLAARAPKSHRRTRELVLNATCRSLSRGMESGEAGGAASRMNINTS